MGQVTDLPLALTKIVFVRSAVLAIAELLVGFTMEGQTEIADLIICFSEWQHSQAIGPCGTLK